MTDDVGYSGTFLSGYTGRNTALIQNSPTIRQASDTPMYQEVVELRSPVDDTEITLLKEVFFRYYEHSSIWKGVARLRLIINGAVVPITAHELRFAWMNYTARPNEERIISPDGLLIFHSDHQQRQGKGNFATWQNQKLLPYSETKFMPHSR